jgi:hypothetical protein
VFKKTFPEHFSVKKKARRTIPGLQNYETGIYAVCFSFEARPREGTREHANGINKSAP